MAVNDVIGVDLRNSTQGMYTSYRPAVGVHVVISFAIWGATLNVQIGTRSAAVTKRTNSHEFSPIPINNDAYLRHGFSVAGAIITGIQIK